MPEQDKGETSEPPAQQQPQGDGAASDAPASATPPPEPPAHREAEAKAAAPVAPPPGGIADKVREALPDLQFDAYQTMTDTVVVVSREDLANVMPVLKSDPRLDLKFLRCLFGVDYLEQGMDVVYQLMSLETGAELVVKTRLQRDDLRVPSVSSIWRAANWHERETRDMFGIEFEGHPHLVPLLLPEDMTDHHPLRKDNPLAEIEEWQGELVPGTEAVGATEGTTEE